MLSSLPNVTSKAKPFSTGIPALQEHKSGLAAMTCILLAFHKIRIPHEKYCKSTTKSSSILLVFSSSPSINIDTAVPSADILCSNSASALPGHSDTSQLHITRLGERSV